MYIKNNIQINKFQKYGWKDEFIEHGKVEELEEKYGLNDGQILEELKNNINV